MIENGHAAGGSKIRGLTNNCCQLLFYDLFMRNYKVLLLFVALMIVAEGCKKYDEGPAISFRGRSERVANTWKAEKVLENGVDKTSDYTSYTVTFTKDGGYTFAYTYGSWSLAGNGKWEFQNDEKEIKVNGVNNQSSETLYILRLKEKSFWYYTMDGNNRFEVHLVPAD